MGNDLTGVEGRIWELHTQGFCVGRIAGLVGRDADHVRNVITGAWLEDKLEARRSKKSRGATC